ncbi:MAG: hypothetical protein KAY59_07035 [Acidobacteria bacterium]|nr:hypothetical protein [Acidobacteriota bacterium]
MINSQEAADAGALLSATLAAVSWLNELNAVLTLCATVVAIWAGSMAALYHFEAWRQKRRQLKQ